MPHIGGEGRKERVKTCLQQVGFKLYWTKDEGKGGRDERVGNGLEWSGGKESWGKGKMMDGRLDERGRRRRRRGGASPSINDRWTEKGRQKKKAAHCSLVTHSSLARFSQLRADRR